MTLVISENLKSVLTGKHTDFNHIFVWERDGLIDTFPYGKLEKLVSSAMLQTYLSIQMKVWRFIWQYGSNRCSHGGATWHALSKDQPIQYELGGFKNLSLEWEGLHAM